MIHLLYKLFDTFRSKSNYFNGDMSRFIKSEESDINKLIEEIHGLRSLLNRIENVLINIRNGG